MQAVDPQNQSPKNVTYRTHPLNAWNRDRARTHDLAHATAGFVNDPDITDRDRIAFALRELRMLGYAVYGEQRGRVDWSPPKMICPLDDSMWQAFGPLRSSRLYRHLARIARHAHISAHERERLALDLYDFTAIFDRCEALQEPYVFTFKGDPALVEAVFQAVGFSTRLSSSTPDDGSEAHYEITIAPPTMVVAEFTR